MDKPGSMPGALARSWGRLIPGCHLSAPGLLTRAHGVSSSKPAKCHRVPEMPRLETILPSNPGKGVGCLATIPPADSDASLGRDGGEPL